MDVTRGLGHPGGLIVTGGLGHAEPQAPGSIRAHAVGLGVVVSADLTGTSGPIPGELGAHVVGTGSLTVANGQPAGKPGGWITPPWGVQLAPPELSPEPVIGQLAAHVLGGCRITAELDFTLGDVDAELDDLLLIGLV